ncbi:frizzled-9-like [Amphibalanus amphitrite]|uniref:frizzled-9-like n=1 Tax=Amphibalanus amphitrite TaxID=1232801 RepID=UPI001C926F80|nr:frizzled-9-like [Amphibalanus amphitrite]
MDVWHVLAALVVAVGGSVFEPHRTSQCEPITIEACQDMPYNVTRMPNIARHETQAEAAEMLQQFKTLIGANCSHQLRFFLCSMFVPMCSEKVSDPIPSCQSVCFEVRDSCRPVLRTFSLDWPAVLNCSRLPVAGGLCMDPSGAEPGSGAPPPPAGRQPALRPGLDTHLSIAAKYPHLLPDLLKGAGVSAAAAGPAAVPPPPPLVCPPRYVHRQGPRQAECAPACGAEVLFTAADRRLAELWMTVWATLCFLSTLFTVLTFWIDTARFQYPERPIVFISMCYNIYSLGYLLRMALGADHVVCALTPAGQRALIADGLDSAGCIVTFLLLYYFGLASTLWWVVLTFTWFLSAGRKWSSEAVQRYATHLHAVAWGVPAVLTVIAITVQTISGGELTGLCYVSRRPLPLAGLVIAPLAAALLTGAFFLALGHASLVRIRRRMRSEGTNTHKLHTLMVRNGVYGLVYMAPAAGVVICYVCEYVHWERWEAAARADAARCPAGAAAADCPLEASVPPVSVFLVKLFMSLIAGVMSGMWVWTSKTVTSWQRFFSGLCCRRRHGTKSPSYAPAPAAQPLVSARPTRPAEPLPSRHGRSVGQISRV